MNGHARCPEETDDGTTRALQPHELYRSRRYATAIYQVERASRLRQLGYEIETGKNGGAELQGSSKEYLEASSLRSQQIREHMEEQGLTGAGVTQIAAHRTRDAKVALNPAEFISRLSVEPWRGTGSADWTIVRNRCQRMCGACVHRTNVNVRRRKAALDILVGLLHVAR